VFVAARLAHHAQGVPGACGIAALPFAACWQAQAQRAVSIAEF